MDEELEKLLQFATTEDENVSQWACHSISRLLHSQLLSRTELAMAASVLATDEVI